MLISNCLCIAEHGKTAMSAEKCKNCKGAVFRKSLILSAHASISATGGKSAEGRAFDCACARWLR